MIELKPVSAGDVRSDTTKPFLGGQLTSPIIDIAFVIGIGYYVYNIVSTPPIDYYSLAIALVVLGGKLAFSMASGRWAWLGRVLPGPDWRVTAEAEPWRMGQPVSLQWNALKQETWVKSLRIDLEKDERAEDTSGSGTAYHRKRAKLVTVASGIEGYEITSGARSFTLPPAMPPTFASKRNRVEWRIVMTAKTKWLLPIRRAFQVTILPPPVDETALPPEAVATTYSFSETSAVDDPLTIRTTGNRTHFVPGQEISGTVTWQSDRPDDRVELRLLWFTQGKGDKEQTVVDHLVLGAAAERGEFRLSVPSDAPCSFSGKVVAVVWVLELAVMPAGAAQRVRGLFQGKFKDKTHRLELIISPTGEELIYQPDQSYATHGQ